MSIIRLLVGLVWVVLCGHPAWAATPIDSLSYSPDVTVDFAGSLLHDETVVEDNLAGTLTPLNLGVLPDRAAITAYHRRPNGDQLFVLDITVNLGGLVLTPRDVIRYDGSGYSLELDGAAAGLPDGAAIDALTEVSAKMAISLDSSALLPGIHVDDEDLVLLDGKLPMLLFDGSAAGVDPALDLDGADAFPSGNLLLSFDGSGVVGGTVLFDDEDVLEYDPKTGTFELVYDGSILQPGWPAADLEALAAEQSGLGGPP